jgi:hypothetical protein
MNMRGLLIFYSLLQFYSSVFYSFHYRCLSFPYLCLFLVILYFELIVNEIVFPISFSASLSLVFGKVSALCMLILYPANCWKCLSLLRIFCQSP